MIPEFGIDTPHGAMYKRGRFHGDTNPLERGVLNPLEPP
jgi:hypothetical protein